MGKKRSPTKHKHVNDNTIHNDTNGHVDTNDVDETSPKKTKYSVGDLLTKINELTENFDYELALKFSKKALLLEPNNTTVLETVGNISAEIGNLDEAKQYFLKATSLQPDVGHLKYLYLGQLSEGNEAVGYYKHAISMMTASLEKNIPENEDNSDSSLSNRDVSNVYCSLAEIYMTDCCMEEDAEKSCESACQQAIVTDEDNPDAYLVMCNFLLTKGDLETAKNIAVKMSDIWKSVTESAGDNIMEMMSYESRMTLIKILIEVELHDKVFDIGIQLLEENEDDIRCWYYIGLNYSFSENPGNQRYYLEKALYLFKKNRHQDEEMLSHIKELLSNCPATEEDKDIADSDGEQKNINGNHTEEESLSNGNHVKEENILNGNHTNIMDVDG